VYRQGVGVTHDIIHYPVPRETLAPICGLPFDTETRFNRELSTINCEKCRALINERGEEYVTETLYDRLRKHWYDHTMSPGPSARQE
jgi:hypothetical protein